MLLARHATVDIMDLKRETALSIAAKNGFATAVQALVHAGADMAGTVSSLAAVPSRTCAAAIALLASPRAICASRNPITTAFMLRPLFAQLAHQYRERGAEFNALSDQVETLACLLLHQCEDLWEVRKIVAPWTGALGLALAADMKALLARHDTQLVLSERWMGRALHAGSWHKAGMVLWYLIGWLLLPALVVHHMRHRTRGFRYSAAGIYWELSHTPYFKFVGRVASFLVFLLLVITATVQTSDIVPSTIEIAVAVWVAGLLLDEINEMRQQPVSEYIGNPWNWLDLSMLGAFFVSAIMRALIWDSAVASTHINTANIFFACGALVSCLRLLHVFQASLHLGPLLVRQSIAFFHDYF